MNTNISEEEVLGLLARLLERLQQAGGANPNGSHYTFVYVAPGAQHVGTIEKQYVQSAPMKSQPNLLRGVGEELPEVLSTPEAMMLWEKAQRAGYVDGRYQPLSRRNGKCLKRFGTERICTKTYIMPSIKNSH